MKETSDSKNKFTEISFFFRRFIISPEGYVVGIVESIIIIIQLDIFDLVYNYSLVIFCKNNIFLESSFVYKIDINKENSLIVL